MESAAQPEHRFLLGARGWEHAGWDADFYPDDLPADWRLAYYANQFPVVLVPAERFDAATGDELEEWADEVGEGFRFLVELSPQAAAEPEPTGARLERLGEALAGVVVDADTAREAVMQLGRRAPVFASLGEGPDLARVLRPLEPGLKVVGRAVAVLPPGAACRTVRQLRAWIDDLRQACSAPEIVLVLDGDPPPVGLLEEGQTLLELMGLR